MRPSRVTVVSSARPARMALTISLTIWRWVERARPASRCALTSCKRSAHRQRGRTEIGDAFFSDVPGRIAYGGPSSSDPLSFAVYQPDRVVLGKRMEDQLRIAVCLWHSFNWPGSDVFGVGTFDRPWLTPGAAEGATLLEVRQRLGRAYYVLWGGREGDEPLLNPDLAREEAQLARFLTLVAEHKHRIGFTGTLLIGPKPQEPTKHQYDYDVATVVGFLQRHGLAGEYRLNLEANHATLAGHSFHHEVPSAIALGAFGSIDVNRGDYQNGWDTDQFPNSVDELSLALHEILG